MHLTTRPFNEQKDLCWQEDTETPLYALRQSVITLQAELEERKKDIQSLHVRIARQDNDIKQLSSQYRSAQQNYERQVCPALCPFLFSSENTWQRWYPFSKAASVVCDLDMQVPLAKLPARTQYLQANVDTGCGACCCGEQAQRC